MTQTPIPPYVMRALIADKLDEEAAEMRLEREEWAAKQLPDWPAFIDTLADVTAQIDGYRRELESVTALIVARRESQYAAERYDAAIRGHLDALHDRRRELEASDV